MNVDDKNQASGDKTNTQNGAAEEERYFTPQASTVFFSAESLQSDRYQDAVSSSTLQTTQQANPRASTATQTRKTSLRPKKPAQEEDIQKTESVDTIVEEPITELKDLTAAELATTIPLSVSQTGGKHVDEVVNELVEEIPIVSPEVKDQLKIKDPEDVSSNAESSNDNESTTSNLEPSDKSPQLKSILKPSHEIHIVEDNADEQNIDEVQSEAIDTHLFLPSQLSLMNLRKIDLTRSTISKHSLGRKGSLAMGNAFVYVVVPPDGGYGWLIVLMSFFAQLIVDGIIFGIGILLPYITKEFDLNPLEASMLSSIQLGFYFLCGPICSALINNMGFRPVILMGSSISMVTILIASYCPNFIMVLLFYSFVGGFSLSLIWVSSQLIIGFYFDKYRPIAYGLAVSGAGAGIVAIAFLNDACVSDLGWRNMFRIHVGLLFLTLLIGITYIEVRPTKVAAYFEVETDSDNDSDIVLNHFRYSAYNRSSLLAPHISLTPYNVDKKSFCTRFFERCCKCCMRDIVKPDSRDFRSFYVKRDPIERQDLFYTGAIDVNSEATSQINLADGGVVEVLADEDTRKTIAYHLLQPQAYPDTRQSKPHRNYRDIKASEEHRFPVLQYLSPKNWISPKITRALSILFDFRLLKNKEFAVLFTSACLFPMGFNIPFVYSKQRAETQEDFKFWITPTIGISNFIVRIMSGFIAYYYKDYTSYLCGGGIFFGGFFVFFSAFYGAALPWFQITYAFCYGIAPAFFSTLRALLYVRCVGLQRLTNAFGITAMGMGLGVFIGTSTGALFNELTNSYLASFIFAGICIMTSGFLKMVVFPYLHAKNARR